MCAGGRRELQGPGAGLGPRASRNREQGGAPRPSPPLFSGWEAVTARLGPGGGRPPCLPGCCEAQGAATWGRIRAGPRWCCFSPLRCSRSRPGCSSTGGRRPCDRRGGKSRRRRRPGPGRCSLRCSLFGPCVSNGSGPGCEPSTARRAGTGYGRARAGGARHRVGGEAKGGEAEGLRRLRSRKESSSPSTWLYSLDKTVQSKHSLCYFRFFWLLRVGFYCAWGMGCWSSLSRMWVMNPTASIVTEAYVACSGLSTSRTLLSLVSTEGLQSADDCCVKECCVLTQV